MTKRSAKTACGQAQALLDITSTAGQQAACIVQWLCRFTWLLTVLSLKKKFWHKKKLTAFNISSNAAADKSLATMVNQFRLNQQNMFTFWETKRQTNLQLNWWLTKPFKLLTSLATTFWTTLNLTSLKWTKQVHSRFTQPGSEDLTFLTQFITCKKIWLLTLVWKISFHKQMKILIQTMWLKWATRSTTQALTALKELTLFTCWKLGTTVLSQTMCSTISNNILSRALDINITNTKATSFRRKAIMWASLRFTHSICVKNTLWPCKKALASLAWLLLARAWLTIWTELTLSDIKLLSQSQQLQELAMSSLLGQMWLATQKLHLQTQRKRQQLSQCL